MYFAYFHTCAPPKSSDMYDLWMIMIFFKTSDQNAGVFFSSYGSPCITHVRDYASCFPHSWCLSVSVFSTVKGYIRLVLYSPLWEAMLDCVTLCDVCVRLRQLNGGYCRLLWHHIKSNTWYQVTIWSTTFWLGSCPTKESSSCRSGSPRRHFLN